jgi:hypothetical protein
MGKIFEGLVFAFAGFSSSKSFELASQVRAHGGQVSVVVNPKVSFVTLCSCILFFLLFFFFFFFFYLIFEAPFDLLISPLVDHSSCHHTGRGLCWHVEST